MKDTVFYLLKDLRYQLGRWKRKFLRLGVNTKLKESDFKTIPIIINNRNRVTFTRQLVDWFLLHGYKNIFILDNDSTYPPLLEYYKTANVNVIRLKKNWGYKALWLSGEFDRFKKGYYVYTDPDLLPSQECPDNVIARLYAALERNRSVEKAGVALRIDDLPEHYSGKQEVLKLESRWWKKPLGHDEYDAPVDTTFALYKPFAWGDAEDCPAVRVGGKYAFHHLPWYENSSAPSEEELYYREAAKGQSSFWYNLK